MGLFFIAVALYALLRPSMALLSPLTPRRTTSRAWFRPLMTFIPNPDVTSTTTTRYKDELIYPKVGDVVAYEANSVSKVGVGEILGLQRASR